MRLRRAAFMALGVGAVVVAACGGGSTGGAGSEVAGEPTIAEPSAAEDVVGPERAEEGGAGGELNTPEADAAEQGGRGSTTDATGAENAPTEAEPAAEAMVAVEEEEPDPSNVDPADTAPDSVPGPAPWVATQAFALRAGPAIDWGVLSEVVPGTNVNLLGRGGEWLLVRDPSGLEGWATSDDGAVPSELVAGLPRAEAAFHVGTVLIPNLNMREGPGTEFPIRRLFAMNEEFGLLGRSTDSDWVAVWPLIEEGRFGEPSGWAPVNVEWLNLPLAVELLPVFTGGGLWVAAVDEETPDPRLAIPGPRFQSARGWLADGRAVLHTSVMDLGGGAPTTLSDGFFIAVNPAGDLAVASRGFDPPTLVFVDSEGNETSSGPHRGFFAREYPISPALLRRGAWSPDGRSYVLGGTEGDGRSILSVFTLGEAPRDIVTDAAGSDVACLPDGRILYLRDGRLRAVDAEGSERDFPDIRVSGFVPSPSGTLIAVSVDGETSIVQVSDGSVVMELGSGWVHPGMWSPSEDRVIWLRRGETIFGRPELVHLDGRRTTLDPIARELAIVWASDGSRFVSQSSFRLDILRGPEIGAGAATSMVLLFDAEGNFERVIARAWNGFAVSWSPDGRWLAFSGFLSFA